MYMLQPQLIVNKMKKDGKKIKSGFNFPRCKAVICDLGTKFGKDEQRGLQVQKLQRLSL